MADNYLYHPLGDFARNYADGTISFQDRRYPTSHSGHKNGGIDFNPGSKMPIYAMADGTVTFVGIYARPSDYSNRCAGYYIELESNNFGYGIIYIRYLEMGWLESPFAEAIGVRPGANGTNIQSCSGKQTKRVTISVKAGDIIGYTNSIGNGQSQLHIDLQINPTLSGDGEIKNGIKFLNGKSLGTGYEAKNGKWYQNGKLIGMPPDGLVPGSGKFPVYDNYWYSTILSTPIYKNIESSVENTLLKPKTKFEGYYSENIDPNLLSDETLSIMCQLCRDEIQATGDKTTDLMTYGVYAKLLRSVYMLKKIDSNSSIMAALKKGGFSNWAGRGYPKLPNTYQYKDEIKEIVKKNFLNGGIYGLSGKFAQIANCYPQENYGYSGKGYTADRNIESELENRIVNRNIVSHITLNSRGTTRLIGCIANTGFFTTTDIVSNISDTKENATLISQIWG